MTCDGRQLYHILHDTEKLRVLRCWKHERTEQIRRNERGQVRLSDFSQGVGNR